MSICGRRLSWKRPRRLIWSFVCGILPRCGSTPPSLSLPCGSTPFYSPPLHHPSHTLTPLSHPYPPLTPLPPSHTLTPPSSSSSSSSFSSSSSSSSSSFFLFLLLLSSFFSSSSSLFLSLTLSFTSSYGGGVPGVDTPPRGGVEVRSRALAPPRHCHRPSPCPCAVRRPSEGPSPLVQTAR